MSIPGEVFLMIPIFLLSLTVHEYAHALTAKWGGDMTATYQGRLTLNPVSHIDPIGTIVVPLFAALSSIPMFGWAKPVPVDEANFRKPNWGVVVALAGPGSNLVLILLTTAIMKILVALPFAFPSVVFTVGAYMILINLILMLFNLIPIPPLDGSHVVWHLLVKGRGHLYPAFFFMSQYGFFILIALLWIPGTRHLFGATIQTLGRFFLGIAFG